MFEVDESSKPIDLNEVSAMTQDANNIAMANLAGFAQDLKGKMAEAGILEGVMDALKDVTIEVEGD